MNKINWLKVIGAVSTVCLVGAVLWGCYNFYFKKPIPIVNNYTAPVTQTTYEVKSKQHLITGLYGNKNEIGVVIGWLW